MKSFAIVILALLAVSNAKDCSDARAEQCIDSLLTALVGDSSEDEVCSELSSSISCLREAFEECKDELDDADEIEEGLQEMEKVLAENCGGAGEAEDEDDATAKCFKENEDYVYECLFVATSQALDIAIEHENTSEQGIQCMVYGIMANCFAERIGEKCGENAEKAAREELEDLPDEIAQACEAASNELISINLLEKKK